MAVVSSQIIGNLRLDDLVITNDNINDNAAIARSKLALDSLKPYLIPWEAFRVWDAYQTTLPGTAASDDLGLIGGTFASASPSIQTLDFKNTTTTAYARFMMRLPAEYADGQTVTLRIRGAMKTTVASSACTVDVQAYASDGNAGIGSDLCATAAQSINSLTPANKDFEITATSLTAGDWLDVRIVIAGTDSATGTAVIGCLGEITLLCDVKG